MTMEDLLEEIEVIKTIYCREGEVVIQGTVPDAVVVSINVLADASHAEASLTIRLSAIEYPSCPPLLSVKSCQLSRSQCEDIKSSLNECCVQNLGNAMLFHIISSFYELLETSSNNASTVKTVDDDLPNDITTCLLRLDHMRNKNQYKKTILRWTLELGLVGMLIFCPKVILILLQGTKEDVKEYIRRNRTQTVDVDSRGRPCKERLLSVLFDDVITKDKVFPNFVASEFESVESVKMRLEAAGLGVLLRNLDAYLLRTS